MKNPKCKNPECGKEFKYKYSTLEKYCSPQCAYSCVKPNAKKPLKPIKRLSGKRKKQQAQYLKDRIVFLEKEENKYCIIKGPTCTGRATTIEHSAGKSGDMLLNQKYWKPACLNCNLELENNPELSKKHQVSKIHLGKKM